MATCQPARHGGDVGFRIGLVPERGGGGGSLSQPGARLVSASGRVVDHLGWGSQMEAGSPWWRGEHDRRLWARGMGTGGQLPEPRVARLRPVPSVLPLNHRFALAAILEDPVSGEWAGLGIGARHEWSGGAGVYPGPSVQRRSKWEVGRCEPELRAHRPSGAWAAGGTLRRRRGWKFIRRLLRRLDRPGAGVGALCRRAALRRM